MKTILTITFFIGFAIGVAYWLLSPLLFGKYVPWDYNFSLYFVTISILGLGLGLLTGKHFWSAMLGVYCGQVIVALLRSQSGADNIGLLATVLWFFPAILSGIMGWLLSCKILRLTENKMISNSIIETYHGICICDVNFNKSDDREFLDCTKKVLDCIKKLDPVAFGRIKKELKYIINKELISGGAYSRQTKSCKIDFGRYRFDLEYDWYFHYYMSTIVHEATHGYLESKGIKYNKKSRARIEKICCRASALFLRKTPYKRLEEIIGKFDESRWHFYWHGSQWKMMKIIFNRIKESRRKSC